MDDKSEETISNLVFVEVEVVTDINSLLNKTTLDLFFKKNEMCDALRYTKSYLSEGRHVYIAMNKEELKYYEACDTFIIRPAEEYNNYVTNKVGYTYSLFALGEFIDCQGIPFLPIVNNKVSFDSLNIDEKLIIDLKKDNYDDLELYWYFKDIIKDGISLDELYKYIKDYSDKLSEIKKAEDEIIKIYDPDYIL